MRLYKVPADGLLITVTNTPTKFIDLVNAAIVAGGGSAIDFPKDMNYVLFHPKDGAILALLDGNNPDNTTTPKTGIEIFQNDKQEFKGAPLNDCVLQRQGAADTKTVVQFGWTDSHGN